MRALTRTRLLAALCVLLLLTFGSIARAGAPTRPIDRSGSPPETEPVMVGDPDEPGGNIIITIGLFGHVYLFHIPSGVLRYGRSIRVDMARPVRSFLNPRRTPHAR
jgi:hypothetical protein